MGSEPARSKVDEPKRRHRERCENARRQQSGARVRLGPRAPAPRGLGRRLHQGAGWAKLRSLTSSRARSSHLARLPQPAPAATGRRSINGRLKAQISADGLVSFLRSDDGRGAAFRAEGSLLVARAQAFPGQRQRALPPGAALSRHTKERSSTASASTYMGASTKRAWLWT